MKSRILFTGLLVGLLTITLGCSSLPKLSKDNATGSNNFSLFKLQINLAAYKSVASSADAGESVVQRSNASASGDETLNVPLSALDVRASATNEGAQVGANINVVPLGLNFGLWKSATASASAGTTADQSTNVEADGGAGLSLTGPGIGP